MVYANDKMKNTNFSASHCSSENTINVAPMLHTPRKSKVHLLNTKSHNLRKHSAIVNVNNFQNKNMLEKFCELVCKPVTVKLTRLEESELRRLTTTVSPKTVPVKRTPTKKSQHRFYKYGKRRRKIGVNKKQCNNNCTEILTETQSNDIKKTVNNNVCNNVHTNVCKNILETNIRYAHNRNHSQVTATSKVQEFSKHKECEEDLLKTVQQPIITLNRIDEVINKLAQSFAKVATKKQNHTIEQPIVEQNVTITHTGEEHELTSTNPNDCSQNNQIDDNVSEVDSDDLSNVKWTRRRKRKLFWESSDESDTDQLYEVQKCNVLYRKPPLQIKKIKLSLPEKRIATSADKHTEEQETTTSYNRDSNELHGLSSDESIETGIPNEETLVKHKKVNVGNNNVHVEEEDQIIENIEVENRRKGINVENIQVVEVQQEVNVKIEDEDIYIDVESFDVDVEKVEIDVENDAVGVEKVNIDAENYDVDVESDYKDGENNGADVEHGHIGVGDGDTNAESDYVDADSIDKSVETCNIGVENDDTIIANVGVDVNNEAMNVESKEDDVDTENTSCSLDDSENAVHGNTKNLTGNSASSLLSSKADIVYTSQDRSSSQFAGDSVCKATEIQQHKLKRSTHESEFAQKNKLCKQAIILLLDLQCIKSSRSNNYSATEIEKLIQKNINPVCSENVTKSTHSYKSSSSENKVGVEVTVAKQTPSNNAWKKGKLYKMTSDGAIEHFVSSHGPKQSTRELGLSSVTESTTKTPSSSLRKFGHSSCTTIDQSPDVTIGNQKIHAKKTTVNVVSMVSPTKYKKLTEKKDSTKSKDTSNNYKCIVCDLCFEDYSVLQQHLSKHAKQQVSSSSKHAVSERRDNVEEVIQPSFSSPEGQALPQYRPINTSTCQMVLLVSPLKNSADKEISLETKSQKKLKFVKLKSSESKKISLKPSALTNECSMCSQEFPTRADLTAHMFLHTENELQEDCKVTKQKNYPKIRSAASATRRTEDSVASSTDSVEKSSTITNKRESSTSKAPTVQNQNEQTSESSEVNVSNKVNKTDLNSSKPVSGKNNPNNQVSYVIDKVDKIKSNRKGGSSKTLFTICQCHNRADVNFNCLQIEIVLLCHTCKVLFRSMECFETHYSLPKYVTCNRNRFESGRSPNLFCATCGMIFSSVQDVRQHLEMHVRFKKDCTMDFRCNICKVMFIGIGSHFYFHWSKHMKDSFWVSNKQSYVKPSVFEPTVRKQGTMYKPGEFVVDKCLDNYVYIAEYACSYCKVVFINKVSLKMHELICSVKTQTEQSDDRKTRQLVLYMFCNLCDYKTVDTMELYVHMKDEHKFASEPQFVSISLLNGKTTYICNICMQISEEIDKFKKHWFCHYTKQPYFVCIYCDKESNSFDAFKEHIKEHESSIKDNVTSCTVKYRDVDRVCKQCHVGFQSDKSFNEHSLVHKPIITNDKDEGTAQKSIPCATVVTNKSDEKEETTEKPTTVSEKPASKSDTDLDKEKLIKILEGNEEEDSENELVIDLTDHLENELSLKDKSKEKQVASVLPTPASSTPASSTPVSSTTTLPPAALTETIGLKFLTLKDEDSNKEAETSDPQKQGLLRVKALADLLEDPNCMFACKVCNLNCKSAEELKQHSETHIKQKQPNDSSRPEVPVSQQPTSSAEQSKPASFTFAGNKFVSTAKTIHIPILTQLYPGTATNAKLLATKLNPVVSSAQPATKTAYHKNLPACNIVRKIMMQRGDVQTVGRLPRTMESGPSNVQSVQPTPIVDSNTVNQRKPLNSRGDSNKYPSGGHLSLATNIAAVVANNHTNRTHDKHLAGNLTAYQKNGVPNKSYNVGGGDKASGNLTNGGQNCIPSQQRFQGQVRMNPPMYYQFQHSVRPQPVPAQRPVQNQQVLQQVSNHTVTRNVTPAFYYKNPASGGMSIVINQTAPTVPNLPPMDIRQQQGQQSQVYQGVYANPLVSVDSYVQQPPPPQPQPQPQPQPPPQQHIIDYSGTGEVYQVSSNEYAGPMGGNATGCERTLQSSADLTCPYCPNSISFTNRDMFQFHVDVSHNFICDLCGLSFYNIDDIRIHKIKHELM